MDDQVDTVSDDIHADYDERKHTLTDKGLELFQENCDKYKNKIETVWKDIENIVIRKCEPDHDLSSFRQLEKELNTQKVKFLHKCNEFQDFLKRSKTHDATNALEEHFSFFNKAQNIIDKNVADIKSLKLELVDNMSTTSTQSDSSSVLQKKRMKAENERTKLLLLRKEVDLQKKKAEVEGDLRIVQQETNIAIAEGEVQALVDSTHSVKSLSFEPAVDRKQMTQNYVNGIEGFNADTKHFSHNMPGESASEYHTTLPRMQPTPIAHSYPALPNTVLNPCAPTFHPTPAASQLSTTDHLTNFLLKKDLLLTRFSNVNDRPESFASWKHSFCNITQGLNLAPHEQVDLLCKWLGPESSEYAKNIKAANTAYPMRGLARIWERLEDRYGKPEMVESALKAKIHKFPKLSNKDNKDLYKLSDILSEIESCKENPKYATLLSYFDSSSGVNPIVSKLPYGLQEKWTTRAGKYKEKHQVPFPPFAFFVAFIREISSLKNDPVFSYDNSNTDVRVSSEKHTYKNRNARSTRTEVVRSNKTNVQSTSSVKVRPANVMRCPIHNAHHSLNDCRVFIAKSFEDRKKLLKENNICFRCCSTTDQIARYCKESLKCTFCQSPDHISAMHIDTSKKSHGGESESTCASQNIHSKEITTVQTVDSVSSKCTALCGKGFSGRSCGKTLLVEVHPSGNLENKLRVYAVIDDQSNRSLASKELLDNLGICGESIEYTLSSCSGCTTMFGRRAHGIVVNSLSTTFSVDLPILIECEAIPNNIAEIPTPDVARHYPHLKPIAENIPPLEPEIKIQLLIGRDLPEVHHVINQIIGPKDTPFAQELSLGWAIIGEVCLGRVHPPDIVIANKTNILSDGRGTIFEPCKNTLSLKDNQSPHEYKDESVFHKSPHDDALGLSVEDRKFLQLMDKEFCKDEEGHWTAPLPFRTPKQPLPNNRSIAWKRAQILDASIKKNSIKREHFVTFMSKVLDSRAAEVAPPLEEKDNECWYLPLFGVYHPKKPDQIRGVFDSSSLFQGISLNSVLLSGPDLTNSLLGVLLRFRSDSVAATVDIEQMFYQFYVNTEHRNYLRFYWYKDNNPKNCMIEYRMRVHVFGNSPSPSIATYGLRKAVSGSQTDPQVKDFVTNNFYVDDGLLSLPTSKEVIEVISKTQSVLKKEGNIRLHKIVSNNSNVMKAFNTEDLGKDLKSVRLGEDDLPVQRSLGISWNLNSDNFFFNIELDDFKPYTKRGMLSTINGLFDPMGFLSPITLTGKLILREVAPSGTDWDEPFSSHHRAEWESWRNSLESLRDFEIPRMFVPTSISTAKNIEVFIFSDASEKAIAAAAYMKVSDNERSHVGFIMGKSKLAPLKGHTIPRLELCGAVLATELGQIISEQLSIDGNHMKYFIDSKVVLGYICNETRRFYNYVSNRVERIRKVTSPSQWNFVPTNFNPADYGTRTTTLVSEMKDSQWLRGPKWLHGHEIGQLEEDQEGFSLVEPQEDREIRPDLIVCKTNIKTSNVLGSHRFEKFSHWETLVKAMSFLLHIIHSFKQHDGACVGWHRCNKSSTAALRSDAETSIVKAVQFDHFQEEIICLTEGRQLPKNNHICALSPFLDDGGVMRVGGRLNKLHGHIPTGQINPILMPKSHHVSNLLVHHFHEKVKHQGRYLTEGALRSGGYWIIGAKNAISSLIHKCVTCRKLRRDFEHQKMADLPIDRLTPGPPFTSVGVDTFGPWEVVTRKTRGGSANSKRWAILFTCLVTRAVHIELVQEMSSSCFINALRRFVSLRGPVKLFRSDRGTNFVGATDDMKMSAINVEDGTVRQFLSESRTTWMFNVPHSSHMGGVWERIIGMVRRILSAVLLKTKNLTHEILSTFMAEVSAILNSRPIAPISSDPESTMILSPSMLLTGKTDFLPVVSQSLDLRDIYQAQWKHVQVLADLFWKHWKKDYMQCLQSRRKWLSDRPNLKVGDIVLMKDNDSHRYNWPTGIIDKVFESDDGNVRKVCVRTIKEGKPVVYIRPISELVLLLE